MTIDMSGIIAIIFGVAVLIIFSKSIKPIDEMSGTRVLGLMTLLIAALFVLAWKMSQ